LLDGLKQAFAFDGYEEVKKEQRGAGSEYEISNIKEQN
jgi:hypothetical protein